MGWCRCSWLTLCLCSFFLNRLLNFMGVGVSLYGLAALYQYVSRDPIIKHMVKCRYCRKRINEKVSDECPSRWWRQSVLEGAWLTRLRPCGAPTARAGRMAGRTGLSPTRLNRASWVVRL